MKKFSMVLLLAVAILLPVIPSQAQANHAYYGGGGWGGYYGGYYGYRPVCGYFLHPGCRAPFRKFFRGAARFAFFFGRGFGRAAWGFGRPGFRAGFRLGVRVGAVSVGVGLFGRRRHF